MVGGLGGGEGRGGLRAGWGKGGAGRVRGLCWDGPGVCGLSSNIYSPKGCKFEHLQPERVCRTRKLEKFKILERKIVIRDRNIVITLTYIGKSCKMLEKTNSMVAQASPPDGGKPAAVRSNRQQPYSAASCSCPAMRASASSSVGSSVSASPSASSRCARLWEPAASTAASVSAASSAATKRGSSG